MDDRESERRNNTKRSLLESARALVEERGSDRISIQEITQRAEVATGTYYNYFDNKHQIFLAVADSIREEMADDLEPIRIKIKDPAMRVTMTLRYYFNQAITNQDWKDFISRTRLENEVILSQSEEQALSDIEDGIKGGRFRVDDSEFTRSLITGMVRHVVCSIRDQKADRKAIDYAIRSILQMLGLPELVSKALTQTPLPPIAASKRNKHEKTQNSGLAPVTSISEYSSSFKT